MLFPAIGGSCPNNESVCFSPLLVAHVLIMNQHVFPKNGPLDNLLLSFCQRRLLSPFLHSMRMTNARQKGLRQPWEEGVPSKSAMAYVT